MKPRSRWQRALPDFDELDHFIAEKRKTANALRRLELDHLPMRNCKRATPCRSGLCPRCMRELRVRLLDFLAAERLDQLPWHFVTIRVDGWKVKAGDTMPFGPLRDNKVILNFLTKLRRLKLPGLIVFGSIETVYVTVENRAVAKPFHLHLMVSGIGQTELEQMVQGTKWLDKDDPFPLRIDVVPGREEDFFRTASYAVKQPLMKKAKASATDAGRLQALKPAERRELILNLGVHGWTGRLILLGMRAEAGRFRRTANLSVTPLRVKSR